jgi:hypothetical protein
MFSPVGKSIKNISRGDAEVAEKSLKSLRVLRDLA